MERRAIGNSRVETTQVTLGTWGLAAESYGPVEESRFRRVVEKALELGVESFDLAPSWGNGRSERVVAETVGDARAETTLITRAGVRWNDGHIERDFGPSALERDCDASLERLTTDRIDLWLLHNPSLEDLEEHRDAITALVDSLRDDGRIRAFGVTTVTEQQAKAALQLPVDALSMPYNLLTRAPLTELRDALIAKNVTVLARSTLHYGMLGGRWGESRRFLDHDHRAKRWNTEALKARVRQTERLRFLVRGDVPSLATAALRYVLAEERVASAVVGPRSTGQLQELLRACKDGPPYLPEEDVRRVSQVLRGPDNPSRH